MRNELLIAFKALHLDQGASGIIIRVLSPPEAKASTIPLGDASSHGWVRWRKEAGRADRATRPCPAIQFKHSLWSTKSSWEAEEAVGEWIQQKAGANVDF